jgi:hypothetical protein
MRSRIASLMFSVFLIGLGSAIFFFEAAEYSLVDGADIQIGTMTTDTHIYSIEGIDKVQISDAEIIIDENQQGIKVELTYNADITKVLARSFTMITDCTDEGNAVLCEGTYISSIKVLVLGYENNQSRTNYNELFNIFIDEVRNKTILNVFALTQPKMTVTVSSLTAQLIAK